MRWTPAEQAILRAAIDRIVPADDFPGAWEAGALEYLDRQLEGDLLGMLEVVRNGLKCLDAEAGSRFGAGFAEASTEEQDALLRDVEKGDVHAAWCVAPERFFELLARTTAEGFYADPAQGGNRDRVSWVMTGFEPEKA
jgi:hypothetical protein